MEDQNRMDNNTDSQGVFSQNAENGFSGEGPGQGFTGRDGQNGFYQGAQDNYGAYQNEGQGGYGMPYQGGSPYSGQGGYQMELEEPISMWWWVLYTIISCIPCVGLIMCFIWGFGKGESKNKSNFFKAQLIIKAIGLVIVVIFYAAIFSMFISLRNF